MRPEIRELLMRASLFVPAAVLAGALLPELFLIFFFQRGREMDLEMFGVKSPPMLVRRHLRADRPRRYE